MKYNLISCIHSKFINSTTLYAKFEIGPWASGQALTVANTLRRNLLSELPGIAITFVKVIGSTHEYDTLPGMQECILDVLLNLKKIILHSQFKIISPQMGFLHVKGPGTVKARDLQLPFFINIQNPDQYIATLTQKGILNIKFLIHSGKNYLYHTPSSTKHLNWVQLLDKKQPLKFFNDTNRFSLTRSNKYEKWVYQRELNGIFFLMNSLLLQTSLKKQLKYKLSNYAFYNKNNSADSVYPKQYKESYKFNSNNVGYFPINAVFSPIKKVNYRIQSQHELTKKEIILFEIWTNGTIDPRSAIHESIKKVIRLFLPLQQFKMNFFINNYGSKLYFNKFNKTYFNKKINKLTKCYISNKNYNFTTFNTISFNIKLNTFKNTNFIFLLTSNCNKQIKYLNNINIKTKYKNLLKNTNKTKLLFFSQLKIMNYYLKKHNNFQKLNIKNRTNILYSDIFNLKLNTNIYSILKILNFNTVSDLILLNPNTNFYKFNNKIFLNLRTYEILELKQSLREYGIIILNN